jgi:uncharacterized membrane protein YkoI
MTQKTAVLISGILTAFLLVIGGGLVGRMSSQSATAPLPTTIASAPVAAIDPSAQVVAQLQQREAQYQQLIDQANQRLQQAYAQQQAAVAQINQARAATAPQVQQSQAAAAAAPAQPAAPTLSADSAINIAIDASGGKRMIRTPELVMFEGSVAYEIGFTNGAIYVDAYSGAVLYNGVTARHAGGSTVASQPPASGGTPSGSGDDGGESGDD